MIGINTGMACERSVDHSFEGQIDIHDTGIGGKRHIRHMAPSWWRAAKSLAKRAGGAGATAVNSFLLPIPAVVVTGRRACTKVVPH